MSRLQINKETVIKLTEGLELVGGGEKGGAKEFDNQKYCRGGETNGTSKMCQ